MNRENDLVSLLTKALSVAVVPLLSLVICVVIMSVAGGASDTSEPPSEPSPLSAGALIVFALLLGIAMIKILAVIGNVARWYFGWLYHTVEINIVIFILGLLLVVSVLSAPLTLPGLVNVITVFLALALNLYLKSLWALKEVREAYHVTHYTHA